MVKFTYTKPKVSSLGAKGKQRCKSNYCAKKYGDGKCGGYCGRRYCVDEYCAKAYS